MVLDVLLLVVAVRNFQHRADTSAPKALDTITAMGGGAVFVLGLGITFMNPKNLVVLIAAGTQTANAGLSTADSVATLVAFALLATLPFSASVAYLLMGGEPAKERLVVLKGWLIARNKLITAIVLAIIGLILITKGIPAI